MQSHNGLVTKYWHVVITTSSLVRIKVTIHGIYEFSTCIFRRIWSIVSGIASETECEH
jgi:hypothetical protein